MRAVIQRVLNASVVIDEKVKSSINKGMLVLIGIEETDNKDDVEWLSAKICNLRIFDDAEGVMNLSVKDVNGEILIASREGAFRSSDSGKTWTHVLNGLPERDISYISCDESGKNLLATSLSTGVIFLSDDGGRSWSPGPDSGYPIRQVKVVRGRLLAATPFDGLVAQP